MSGFVHAIPADTLEKQRRAADPRTSAWVSANAGSGKTFVLTRRVVRLLLEGVAPSRILCLTFTKAAAAQMSLKVFETLSAWVTLDDAALASAIHDTGAAYPDDNALARARRLFARTVETPGGLKILTIHAFCEKLLHTVPFEANVAARFTLIEELRQQELLSRAQEAVLAEAVAQPDSPPGRALEALAQGLSSSSFAVLTGEFATHYGAMRATIEDAGGLEGVEAALQAALRTGGRSVADVERAMLEDGLPPSEWDSVGRHLVACMPKGSGIGEDLIEAAATQGSARLDAYLAVFLTQKLEPRADSYLPKPLRAKEPALCRRLDGERDRLLGLLNHRRAAAAVERTMALLAVAGAVLDRYETLKSRRGLLDFADLIERTRMLLSRSDAAWVLYKLDAGIDHVLVDEAQDTSPDQWTILGAVCREFFAGAGRSAVSRTFFAVGDEKQSIYSFQGARPAMFDTARRAYAKLAEGAGQRLETIDLALSFRSVATVLRIVDDVFAHGDNARGLSAGADKPMPHEALKRTLPGRFELWPAVGPEQQAEPGDWTLPVDAQRPHDPAVVVATRVADEIVRLTAPGSVESVEAGKGGGRRPVRPGDILVLVRTRSAFFDAVIRALKDRRVPVAGADRLKLTDHIATMDLVAAGRAALLPDDDLTLACVLKSPLIGFDDEDLLRLAPGRTGSLDAALRASDTPRDRAAAARLGVWRDRAAALTPFAFYTRLLGLDGGRRALLARLGPEAGDVLDEFLALTLAHERDGAPSLLGFLARLEGADLSIKRDMESAADAVRVMTVHAAKGLEAKIVFLPDTCGAPTGRHDPKLFRLDDVQGRAALLAWSPRVDADPEPVAARRVAAREAALDEHRRLLYVAMTRAEERLIVAGFHGPRGPALGSWYEMMVTAPLGTESVPAPWDPTKTILQRGGPLPPPDGALVAEPARAPALPDWLTRPAPPEHQGAPPIRPSTALQAADRPDRPAEADPAEPSYRRQAVLTGRLMHRLLQHMPNLHPAARRDAGLRFLARHGRSLPEERRSSLVDEAMAILADPRLAGLFGPGSRAEVGVAATVRRPGRPPLPVTGQIDRLGEIDDDVVLADFKTGLPRPLAGTPPSYLAQLALYRAALQPLFPGKTVRAVLVWTAGPGVVEIDADTLDRALDEVPDR